MYQPAGNTLSALLRDMSGVSITIAIDDLREVIREIVNEERERASAQAESQQMPELMGTKEVLAVLSISRNSLYRMRERGELVPRRVGRLVRYLRSDVETALRNLKKACSTA